MSRVAVLLGASGLVGGHCLRLLLDHASFTRVVACVRRPLGLTHPKLVEQVVDFDKPMSLSGDDLFCCLGTTRAIAGSAHAFRRVDYDYPLTAACAFSTTPGRKLLLVSSYGANARSPFLYPRTKGELEAAVSALPFAEVHVFRPSFLTGAREEERPMESTNIAVFSALGRCFPKLLGRIRPVSAEAVARAMIEAAVGTASSKVSVHESETIAAGGSTPRC